MLMIMTVSRAAFVDTTENPGNTWTAGALELTDNKNGTALFTVADMAPGHTGDNCIEVTKSGVDADIVLSGTATNTALGSFMTLSVTRYPGATCTGTSADVYSGTLAGFPTGITDSWDTTVDGNLNSYYFEWTFPQDATNGLQNATAGASFLWTATSN